MVSFEAQIYRDEALPMLKRLRARMPTIDRVVREAIAETIVGDVQANKLRGQVLHRRTGDLAASIAKRSLGPHDTAVGSYGVVYARIHELGGTIRPVRKKHLRFQIGGHWITTDKVRMPRRAFLLPTIVEDIDGGKAMGVADRVLQRELDKVEGR